MRAESQQKQRLKEERRQLELMREEVIRNRIRRQTEELATTDLNLRGAASRGQAADPNSKREASTLQYYDGVKMRTFRSAKIAPVSRGFKAQPATVPVHPQAGAFLR